MGRKLDLVLISPSSRTQVYQSLATRLAAVEPPVWAGLMASFCRRRGLSVRVIDAEAEQFVPAEVADRVEDLDPVLAAVVVYGHQPSASTQIMTAAGQVCSALKQADPTQKVLLLGGHVAALPERTLREEEADFVAVGEGLHTLLDLVAALKTPDPELAKVPGLCYLDGEQVCRTPDLPLVADLDAAVPAVAWDLLPMGEYRAHNWHCLGGLDREPYAAIYTTLGCPYHCSFCCIQAPYKSGERAAGMKESVNSYRFWSPERVLEQIDELVTRYGVRNLKIADEMFVLNRRHVLGVCDGIIRRGYDLNVWAYTRVDTVKDGMLDRLKQAGFNWLAFGIESGADRVRADVDKAFAQEEVYRVLARVREAGIHVIGNYIFGLPEDDEETMRATLELALDLGCEFANFYSTMAYPGSPLYDLAVRRGVPLPARWTGYSQHSRDCLPLPTRHLPAREVLRFRDEAFLRYYTDPGYLGMVGRRFGEAAVEHVRHMTGYRLERDLLTGKLDVPAVLLPAGDAPVQPLELIRRS
jgi:radical SAM superfamily enzyme YgiQ (UPF0313 family)